MIIGYDLETTSAEPGTCRVVQVAAVRFNGDEQETVLDEITNPGLASCDAATEVHGITPEMWEGKRADHEALAYLYAWLEERPEVIIAGHNVSRFDLPILWRIVGRPALGNPVIDTLTCAQRLLPLAPSHRLTTNPKEPDKAGLIESLQLGEVEGAHTAAGDAHMVMRLVEHFRAGLNKSLHELAAWCATPRIHRYCSFGKHKGKPWGKDKGCVPSGYAWFIAQNFDPSPDLEATIYAHYGYRFKKAR